MKRPSKTKKLQDKFNFKLELNLQNILITAALALAILRFLVVPVIFKSPDEKSKSSKKSKTDITTKLQQVLSAYNISELWQHQKENNLQVHIPTKFRFVDFHLSLNEALEQEGFTILSAKENSHETRYDMVLGNNRDSLVVVFLRKDYLPNKAALLSIIIDDFGYHFDRQTRDFVRFPSPLTLSIIPHLKYSSDIALEASMVNKEILIHMPMEPLNAAYDDDGLVLLTSQSSGEWRIRLQKAFSLLKTAKGLNNHQGSKATINEDMMRVLMDEIKDQGLFFIDSKTNANSIALNMARQMKIPSAENNIFLDAKDDSEFINSQLDRLAEISKSRGYAIGIGHVRKKTLKVLEKKLPELEARGFQMVSVSDLVF